VVVNDSLVLIDATNRIRREGASVHDAITQGGALRFRAVILTSFLQAQFLIPMAVSLGFGVLFATFITLLLVPCGYVILDDLHNSWAKLKVKIMRRETPIEN
jgi:multidrug efflux pump subunit AcrB